MDKNNIKIFAWSSSQSYATNIWNYLWVDIAQCEIKNFSCWELYVKLLETVRWKEVFIVKLFQTWRVNEDLMELLLLCDAAKQSFAKTIHLIIPHFPYSRQDKIHHPRESISAKLVARLIESAWANEIITVDLHSEQLQWFFDIPVDNLNVIGLFTEIIKEKNIDNLVIVAPDIGAAKYAKKIADNIWASLAIIHKSRPGHNISEVNHVIWDVKWKTPILFDDMVDTAWSVCWAKNALIEMWSNEDVYLIATHPVLSWPAYERLKNANFKEIIFANTLYLEDNDLDNFTLVPSENLISKVVKNIIERKSVSTLY